MTQQSEPVEPQHILRAVERLEDTLHEARRESREDRKEVHTELQAINGRVRGTEQGMSFFRGGLAVVAVVLLPIAFIVIGQLFGAIP